MSALENDTLRSVAAEASAPSCEKRVAAALAGSSVVALLYTALSEAIREASGCMGARESREVMSDVREVAERVKSA